MTDILTTKELAQRLGCSEACIRTRVQRGALPAPHKSCDNRCGRLYWLGSEIEDFFKTMPKKKMKKSETKKPQEAK